MAPRKKKKRPVNRRFAIASAFAAGLTLGIGVGIGALLLLSGDDVPASAPTPPASASQAPVGPYSFSGTLNYDMPTPSAPVPNHPFAFDTPTEVSVSFTISPVWQDCGFWWRIDATPGDFYYFGGHVLNDGAAQDSVSLPSGSFELQVGVSYDNPSQHTCSGTAAYKVNITR